MNHPFVYRVSNIIAAMLMAAICCFDASAQTEKIKLPPRTVEGKLSNGLRYLILPNGQPQSRAEFRLVMQVGSLQQTAEEGGCAHFLEHVAFGPSTHFPGRSKVEYLESLGMKYGQDINAFTGFDRTIYLFAVPTDRGKEAAMDQSLLILRDWLAGAIIDSAKVENEKGIILEELRGYDLGDDFYDLKIGNGIYRQRLPLGTADEIKAMTARTLKNFYHRWYRPEHAAIIVVGDIHPQTLEQKIIQTFSSLQNADTSSRQDYPLVYEKGIHSFTVMDSLQKRTRLEIIIPHPCTVESTFTGALQNQQEQLLVSAISARFRALKLDPQVSDDWYLSDKNHFVLAMEGKDRQELADKITATANACKSLQEQGWDPAELEAIKERFCQRMHLPETSSKLSSAWCDDFTDYVLSGDCYMTDSLQFIRLRQAVAATTSQELQELLARRMEAGKNALLAAWQTYPQFGEIPDNLLADAWQKGEAMPCQPFTYQPPEERQEILVATPPCLVVRTPYNPEHIKKQRVYKHLGIQEVELTNGIRLILKPTPDQSGELLMTSFAPGSLSALSKEEYPLLADLAGYMEMGGIAKVNHDTLSEYLYQNNIALSMAIENHWHGFMGASPVSHAPEFFRLVYEKIFHPEIPALYPENEEEEESESMLSQMLKRDASRQLAAYLDEIMGNALPYANEKPPKGKQATAQELVRFYQELYTRTTSTYLICGDFQPDSLCRQFVSVFGDIPPYKGKRQLVPADFQLPDTTFVKGFPNGNDSQIVFDYLLYGHYPPGLQQTLLLKLMRDIIRNRLISVLREGYSLVYSPYIGLTYEGYPYATYYFDINASARKENMEKINDVLQQIFSTLQQEKVTREELRDIKRSFLIAKRETLTDQSPGNWRNTLTNLLKNGETLQEFDRYEQVLERITPARLRKAFRQYLHLEPHALLYLSNQHIEKP